LSLQNAYAGGNTISTTGDNIDFVLNGADNFTVTTTAGATGGSIFALADGSNGTPLAQLVLVENQDTNEAITSGIKVQSAGGAITSGIDLSDTDIVDAINIGANNINGSVFDVDGATGNITAGDIAVNGASQAASFDANDYYSRVSLTNPWSYQGASDPDVATWNARATVGTDVSFDPLFSNDAVSMTSIADLRLQKTSTARRAGVNWGGKCIDYRGRPCWLVPDLGAYQHSSGDIPASRTAATSRSLR
jgi:hypothetical protein